MDDDGVFDHTVAARYDDTSDEMFSPEVIGPTVDFLAGLAGEGGRALEFATGTGRVALPLAERGIEVHGIEMSQAMTDKLLAKPGADRVTVTRGNMATTRLDGSFQLVYLVYNTIGNLLTQEEQVDCFANAAAHLAPGGSFVIELLVPELRRLPPGERHVLFASGEDGHLGIDEYDVVSQRLTSHHYWVGGDTMAEAHTPQRYIWPSELDLMARLAGMTRTQRWSSWTREPFTSESPGHISVWAKD